MNWTAEMRVQLAALWKDGMPCSGIAGVMGMGLTKNAIIGAARRADLPMRKARCTSPNYKRWKSPALVVKRVAHSHQNVLRINQTRTRPPMLMSPAKDVPLPSACAPIMLLDRLPFHCSWIIGATAGIDTKCCGAPVTGHDWCGHHNRIGWYPRKPKARPAESINAMHFSAITGALT